MSSSGGGSAAARRVPARKVYVGAVIWIVAVVQFVIAMVVTQLGWTTPYSLAHNFISDLGAIHCGDINGRYVCSPWHDVFNLSIIVFGLLVIVGALLLWEVLARRRWGRVGLAMMVVAGIGGAGVGVFPEDYNLTAHGISALLAFVLANLAIITLGLVRPLWDRRMAFRAYSVLSGLFGLFSLAVDFAGAYKWGGLFSAWGVGGMERTVMIPALIWLVVASIALLGPSGARLEASADTRSPGTA